MAAGICEHWYHTSNGTSTPSAHRGMGSGRGDDGRETDCDRCSCVVAGRTGLTPVLSTCAQHPGVVAAPSVEM